MATQRLYEKGGFVETVDCAQPWRRLEVPLPRRWYVLELFANRETRVLRDFRRENKSFYFPTITQSKLITRRRRGYEITVKRDVTSPLFPGLCFIPDFECNDNHLLSFEGVVGFLRFGDWIANLSPKLMADVRTLEQYGNIPVSRRRRLLTIGQHVRVVDGPFSAFNGTISRLDSNGRLSVLVDLFKRMVPVMLDENQIEPA